VTQAQTVGELRASGYADRTVKQELRQNLLNALRSNDRIFPTIIGYEESVLPTLERGILAGHDIILLGERGQAKTRLIRHLVELLDPLMPIMEGCEINDHPYRPICASCRALVIERGEDAPVVWVRREERYSEKLATPDTSVADLIGDVDPMRVAEGRYLADELTIHYGIIPRTNRGIFAVNELPDLPERIQVALLNLLEERDIQIRGYKIRLPLDMVLIVSANPEDYTHRGRIISPLKDRFGTQVRTHYPEELDHEIAIMDQEARSPEADVPVHVPHFLKEVIAEFTGRLRNSPQVNQRSGVSVRYSIGNLETLVASAIRRAAMGGETRVVPRPVDLWTIVPSSMGRVEFETLEEGREESILEQALKQAIAEVFRRRLGGENFSALTDKFESGLLAETSEMMGAENFLAQFGKLPGLARIMRRLEVAEESPAAAASALEFALEGLHLMRRINKNQTARGAWRFDAK
jgi:magnesium chelatase subunit I